MQAPKEEIELEVESETF